MLGGKNVRPAREHSSGRAHDTYIDQYPVFWVSFLLAINSLAGRG